MLVMDLVFRALADPTRRRLLDGLRAEDGQTLGRLCASLDITRQSVTQHLAVLEEANLISTVRRGREKLHYLNPVPIHDLRQRWIAPFEEPRLRTLDAIRRHAEEQPMKPNFVYVTYIRATPARVWEALTSADLTGEFWGHHNVSDWRPGSSWEHVRTDGSGIADGGGVVLEADPPHRLVMTFGEAGSGAGPDASTNARASARSPEVSSSCVRSSSFSVRSWSTCPVSVSPMVSLSGPAPSAMPTASARNTEMSETRW